jgi:hypothetical protein
METRKKYAFISYSHRDERHARWLQRKLESYKLPTEIHNEYEDSRYLRPIFRDRADLGAGVLNNELRKHLESSKYLIVVCSPESAHSKWVNDEVRTFLELGRGDYIIPYVVAGDITSEGDDNPIPPVLRDYYKQNPDRELLSVDIRESGRSKAYIRVVSYMLGVEFDELWHRHLRALRHRITIWLASIIVALVATYWFAMPVSLSIRLHDDAHVGLPMPEYGVVWVDDKEYKATSLDGVVVVDNLPGYYRMRDVEVRFEATYYKAMSNSVTLGAGIGNSVDIALSRDDSFGLFAGRVFDEEYRALEGVKVDIEGHTTTTNELGEFSITIDVAEQSCNKRVVLSKDGYRVGGRDDECPGENIQYILHREIE